MQYFISFIAGVILFYSFQYFPFSIVLIFLLSSAYLIYKRRSFLILIIISGTVFAFIRYKHVIDYSYIQDKFLLSGTIESYPIKTETGMFKNTLQIESAINIENNVSMLELSDQKVVLVSRSSLDPGTECKCIVKFFKNNIRLNPGEIKRYKLYAIVLKLCDINKPISDLNSIIQRSRYKLDLFIDKNFEKNSRALIKAITLGQKAEIDDELRDAFNKTGLAHLLCISGTHFGLFYLLLFGFFKLIIKYLPYRILLRITIYLTPSQAASLLSLPFIFSYLLLSGANIPAVRSFIIISLFLASLIIGRKDSWLNSLVFAAFIIVVWEPEVIFSLSFQLSFTAVLFIGFSIRHKNNEDIWDKKENMFLKYVKTTFLITLSASIGTAPIVAYYFHYFSIISPLSNLFVAPLVGFLLIPLSVVSSFLFLITGHYVFTPIVTAVSDVSISAVKLLSYIPFSDIKIPAFPPIIILLFYTGFVFYFLFGKKRYFLLIPFIPILIYFSLSIFQRQELTVTYLDVGQGDSSVIELPDRKTFVIDTGKTGRETASFLKYRGKKTIDAIILSHIHSDHTGGLEYLMKRFKIKELWDNGMLIYTENFLSDPSSKLRTGIRHRTFNRGDVIEGKGYRIYILHPYPEFYTMYGNENVEADNYALVLKIEGKDKSFLFTGDIQEEAEEDLFYLSSWLISNVIKIPHHGSKNSAYRPFLEMVSPQVAVISVGRNNPFGHPHNETLDALSSARILRTDIDGAIKITDSINGLKIKTYKDFQFQLAKSLEEEIENLKRLFETW